MKRLAKFAAPSLALLMASGCSAEGNTAPASVAPAQHIEVSPTTPAAKIILGYVAVAAGPISYSEVSVTQLNGLKCTEFAPEIYEATTTSASTINGDHEWAVLHLLIGQKLCDDVALAVAPQNEVITAMRLGTVDVTTTPTSGVEFQMSIPANETLHPVITATHHATPHIATTEL